MVTFIQTINGYLWGFPMIAFLFFVHIFLTVKTGFVQRKVLAGVRISLKKDSTTDDSITPFGALATSLASTLGTGNIIGVSTAVTLGGAGAVFWCWITGVFGMATQYCECFLSVKYREKSGESEYCGGPMYVLKNGVKSRRMGFVYALLASIGGLITGAAIQTNAISSVVFETFKSSEHELSKWDSFLISALIGTVVAVLTALVIFGGLRSVSQVCSMVVPFMAAAYALGCFAVLYINREFFHETIKVIVSEAFSLKSSAGGVVGSALMLSCRYGASRGLFSNEAGIGTSSVICASAENTNPVKQGLVSMTATFWDTVVMCLITGLVVVSTGISGEFNARELSGAGLCYEAFCRIPYIGRGVLVFSIVVFALSTVLGWSAIGEKCFVFMFGGKSVGIYRMFWIGAVFVSAFVSLEFVWAVGDLINAVLVLPNVTALLLLGNEVKKETRQNLNSVSKTKNSR